jgi:hypothetical protein
MNKNPKKIIKISLIIALALISFFATAQQSITFKWDALAGVQKTFAPVGSETGQSIIVNWGDGTAPQTFTTGLQGLVNATHTYATAGNFQVTTTEGAGCTLTGMRCHEAQLTDLNVSNVASMVGFWCYDNHLQLSHLYAVSQKISFSTTKRLGPQNLKPQFLPLNGTANFSAQTNFGGTNTVFTVFKNEAPAAPSDYTMSGGVFTFLTVGEFVIKMTNAAITTHSSYPAEVYATFFVGMQHFEFTWEALSGVEKDWFDVKATQNQPFTVYWGDGTADSYTGNGSGYVFPKKTYAVTGDYTVTVAATTANCKFTDLGLAEMDITAVDISNSPTLTYFTCRQNKITALDVSGNPNLERLSCSYNLITTLDVSVCPNLEAVYLGNNPLTYLNASGTKIEDLYCGGTQLITLDVSNCTELEELNCRWTPLETLNASGCTNLTRLVCENNKIHTLNINGCTNLEELHAGNNQLAALDVNGFTNLRWLFCYNNQLNTLDVSGLTNLEWLNCGKNQLPALDVNGCTKLGYLQCDENQLTSLNVNGCTNLVRLNCDDNKLTSLNVSGATALKYLY